jgi:hypothetical protein
MTTKTTIRKRRQPTREQQALAKPVGQKEGKYAEMKTVHTAKDAAYSNEHAAYLVAGML